MMDHFAFGLFLLIIPALIIFNWFKEGRKINKSNPRELKQ